MPDVFTKTKRSFVMSRIRSRGNKETELALVKIFRAHKITGWRRHVLLKFKVQGLRFKVAENRTPVKFSVRPDFIFPRQKLAVLVDGCFWHGCPRHSNLPVNNRPFWRKKLSVNAARDRLVNRALRRLGWRVIRIWEHELRDPNRCLAKIQNGLKFKV